MSTATRSDRRRGVDDVIDRAMELDRVVPAASRPAEQITEQAKKNPPTSVMEMGGLFRKLQA